MTESIHLFLSDPNSLRTNTSLLIKHKCGLGIDIGCNVPFLEYIYIITKNQQIKFSILTVSWCQMQTKDRPLCIDTRVLATFFVEIYELFPNSDDNE